MSYVEHSANLRCHTSLGFLDYTRNYTPHTTIRIFIYIAVTGHDDWLVAPSKGNVVVIIAVSSAGGRRPDMRRTARNIYIFIYTR